MSLPNGKPKSVNKNYLAALFCSSSGERLGPRLKVGRREIIRLVILPSTHSNPKSSLSWRLYFNQRIDMDSLYPLPPVSSSPQPEGRRGLSLQGRKGVAILSLHKDIFLLCSGTTKENQAPGRSSFPSQDSKLGPEPDAT